MTLFKNKYRVESARLRGWDYGRNGAYFITICTKGRKYSFGEIYYGEMILTETGKMAHDFWLEIPKHFPYVKLGEFVVMPNHIHGVLIIDKNEMNWNGPSAMPLPPVETPQCDVSTGGNGMARTNIPGQKFKNEKMSKITPKRGTISTIMNSYKSVVSKHAHRTDKSFEWQGRFYDMIIWNSRMFRNIENYIRNNPKNWENDMFYWEI